jgi:transcriptional regulator with XRE-family HTH domain
LVYSGGVDVDGDEAAAAPLAVVVGQNCRRIRSEADVTQNMLAKNARNVGLRWTASKVGQFERGQNTPTFGTVLAVSIALSWATERDVLPADLVEFDGFIEFNNEWKLTGPKVVAALRGEPWGVLTVGDTGMKVDREFLARAFASRAERGLPARYGGLLVRDIEEVQRRSGLDEERLAKRLGIDNNLLAEASVYLWGRSFSDERDRLSGPAANAQKRGQVSRKLQKQIQEELVRGDD